MHLACALVMLLLAISPVLGSLPSVTSGARPGPDVLYAPAPSAPQLENRDPRFRAAPLRVSGAEAYVAGEYLYQDFLYDDFGSNSDGAGALPLSPRAGDVTYPTNRARYGYNAADLVELRIAVTPTEVAYRITLNTLLESDSTIVTIAFDTDRNTATGASVLPRDPGAPFPGTDEVLTVWGTGADHVRFGPLAVATPLAVTTDLEANQLTVVVPRTVSDPRGTWRAIVAVGLYDPSTGGWLRPQPLATATQPGGAGLLDPLPCGIFNLGFRFDEPVLDQDTPPDTNQGTAIRSKTPQSYAHDIDFAALDAGETRSTVPASGIQIRFFASRLELGEGREDIPPAPASGPFPQYRGQLQPYALYVPTTYSPATPAGLVLNLHSLGEYYWQYNGATMNQQIGEQRGALVATALSRGPDGWYQHEAEYDVFEMWSDVVAHFTVDPERAAISGYSMGGYATYRLGGLYPDLFGKAFTQVGPPGDGIWLPPAPPSGGIETLSNLWLENTRNLPYLNVAGSQDQLVPFVGPRAQNLGAPEHGIDGFDQLGYRFRFLVFQTDHFVLAALGYDFPFATAFLGDARVDRNPPHVTFAYLPDADDPALGLVHDHAYWVSAVRLAEATGGTTPAKAVVDAFSHGFGLGDAPSAAGAAVGTEPLPYEEVNRSWGAAPVIPVANRLDVALRNVASVQLDTARANLDPASELAVVTDADVAGTVHLDGAFPACSRVVENGAVVPGASAGPAGAAVPVAVGAHTYAVTCLQTFELRRLGLTHAGGGSDKLTFRGRTAALIAQLGLPGGDVSLTLANASGDFFAATVPAALLRPNGNGTKLRFRDASGTLAGGITSLRIGGRRRTDISVRARGLDLSAATPGPFTGTLDVGPNTLSATGTLRAAGRRLAYP
jgi:hypothetical protein